jgi:hypothetical protein
MTDGEVLRSIKLSDIAGSAPAGAYDAFVDFAASIGYTLQSDRCEGIRRKERAAITARRPRHRYCFQ